MLDAIEVMSTSGLGCVGVTTAEGHLAGIITDGDLRRHAARLGHATVDDVMTKDPKTVSKDAIAGEALQSLMKKEITALFVVEDKKPISVVHVHDLLRQGVL